ncbi:MlaD family protein [Conexibacter sp. SYSU D00693]|uniref:MlaD family protein n=1 Tax=Conexibacter sp. SYSU D00693 TaxID=2812560 RepID=UPI00196B9668|nr:MlaD family protein [Conexibacter sp. SYSU D00693]
MSSSPARALAVVVMVVAAAVVAVVLVGGRAGSYEVVVTAQDAGQLVEGNLVEVGGAEVGTVQSIELTPDNRAQLRLRITDEDLTPLHEGTRASIRSPSLSSVAGRLVALHPGPDSARAIPDGGRIGAESTEPIVDLDAVINTLDAGTRSALQDLVHGTATAFGGDRAAANRGLEALSPALTQTSRTLDQLLADQPAFERFLVEGATVVDAVAAREDDLAAGVVSAAGTADAVAAAADELDGALRAAPGTLRRANTTLANLRAAAGDLRPAVRDAVPVAPRLRAFLAAARPVLRAARPVVGDVRRLLPDAGALLRGAPALEDRARPAFAAATEAVGGLQDEGVVDGVRAYTPDLVAGLLNGFGGTTGASYDANGHYTRIGLQGNPFSGSGLLSLGDAQPADNPLLRFRRGVVERCPGAATQAAPDASNPWLTATPCKEADSLR